MTQPHSGEMPHQQEQVTDEQRIYHGITEALREERPIDDATARAIASQLHDGQASPLYALASSGALQEGLDRELDTWRRDSTSVEVEPWLDALDEYLIHRAATPEPVDGWAILWPGDPPSSLEAADAEIAACEELFERISVAGVRQLGDVATVDAIDQDDEPDDFPWTDAATWSPTEAARASLEDRHYASDELDALFELHQEEIGTVDELGWHGLVRHQDKPGGLILIHDQHGFRHVREAQDHQTLDRLWSAIQQDYETFYEQRDAYTLATEDPEVSPSGLSPRIWVGSLADYNEGGLYGAWMDATLSPDQLHAATQFMLRHSRIPDAEEWAIFDYDEFGGFTVEEYASFQSVSRIARGIAAHGEAYAKWVEHVGEQSEDLLTSERFQDHYQGTWESAEAYVEHYLTETDSYDFMRFVPDSIKHYVSVDVEMLARDMQMEGLLVEEMGDGSVGVFWTG